MGNWGEEWEEELQRDEKLKVGLLLSFKSMSLVIQRIEEETREWDDKYPKSELLKIWGSTMVILLFLFTFSYSALIVATGLFFFFYGYVLLQLGKAWKRFKYSAAFYWGITIPALILVLILGINLQTLIFK